jgi:hypothetical protein
MRREEPEWQACGPDGWVAPVTKMVSNSPLGYPIYVEIETGLVPETCLRVPGRHIIAMGDKMVFLNLTAAQLDEMRADDLQIWPTAA